MENIANNIKIIIDNDSEDYETNSFFAGIFEKLNKKASYYQINPSVFIGLDKLF